MFPFFSRTVNGHRHALPVRIVNLQRRVLAVLYFFLVHQTGGGIAQRQEAVILRTHAVTVSRKRIDEQFPKVYINGEKQTTKFLNNTRLDLKESEIKDGDQIMVAQCGSSNTIFRTSKTYEYTGGQLVEVTDQDTDVENGRQAFVEQKEEKKK